MLDGMREGQASQTAVMVGMGRAVAHIEATVPGFSDPTALALLPDEARARVRSTTPTRNATKWRGPQRWRR